jgi:hypothetical protein
MVENRRDQDYLIHMFTPEEVEEQKLTKAELEKFQLTFMELDCECRGSLDVDELKLLMVLMGERMDKEEIKELLDEYDTDKSGNLDFKEFVIMMKGWNTRFGKGLKKLYNQSTKRGAIGKSRRAWRQWLTRDLFESAQVQAAKERNAGKRDESREQELQFLEHEQMRQRRENEAELRAQGLSKSPNYVEPARGVSGMFATYFGGGFSRKQDSGVKLPPIVQPRGRAFSSVSDITK